MKKLSHQFPLTPEEKQIVDRIRKTMLQKQGTIQQTPQQQTTRRTTNLKNVQFKENLNE